MHECPECGQACDCDGEDIWNDFFQACDHDCEPMEDEDDCYPPDESLERCSVCNVFTDTMLGVYEFDDFEPVFVCDGCHLSRQAVQQPLAGDGATAADVPTTLETPRA